MIKCFLDYWLFGFYIAKISVYRFSKLELNLKKDIPKIINPNPSSGSANLYINYLPIVKVKSNNI